MAGTFLKVFDMGVAASWLILAVLAVRLLLRNTPKWIRGILWAMVAVRLICPFTVESALSLVPRTGMLSGEEVILKTGAGMEPGPLQDKEAAADGKQAGRFSGTQVPQAGLRQKTDNTTAYVSFIWLAGLAVMLVYAVAGYFRLCRRVRVSFPVEITGIKFKTKFKTNSETKRKNAPNQVWICDEIRTPFILGVIRPRIYVPSSLGAEQMKNVAAHEAAHIRRRDHLWKPLGFMLLAVYWFHPLCWISYALFCRDIELACDERVVKDMDLEGRKAYSEALLSCSIQQKLVTACPLAFGEAGVKERVKSILNYRKPAFWAIVAAVAACVAVSVCFLTNPREAHKEELSMAGSQKEELNEEELNKEGLDREGLNMEILQEGRFYRFTVNSTVIDNPLFTMEVPQELAGRVNCIVTVDNVNGEYVLESAFFYDPESAFFYDNISATMRISGKEAESASDFVGGGWLGSIFWEDLMDYEEQGILDELAMRASTMDIVKMNFCYNELIAPVGRSVAASNHHGTGAYFFIQPSDVQYPPDSKAAADAYFALEAALVESVPAFTPKSFPMDKSYNELHEEGKLPEEYSLNDAYSAVLTDFLVAEEACAWFRGCHELNTDAEKGQFTQTLENGTQIPYEAVAHMEFFTLEELETFLGCYFPEGMVQELMQTKLWLPGTDLPLFVEKDGILYVAKGHIGAVDYHDYDAQYCVVMDSGYARPRTATVRIRCTMDLQGEQYRDVLEYTMIQGEDDKWRVTEAFELPVQTLMKAAAGGNRTRKMN